LPLEEAERRVRADAGKQFAPEAVAAFDTVVAEFHAVREGADRAEEPAIPEILAGQRSSSS
jgi:response regulator RpfG family c-di-GMP phosphodiesterase